MVGFPKTLPLCSLLVFDSVRKKTRSLTGQTRHDRHMRIRENVSHLDTRRIASFLRQHEQIKHWGEELEDAVAEQEARVNHQLRKELKVPISFVAAVFFFRF